MRSRSRPVKRRPRIVSELHRLSGALSWRLTLIGLMRHLEVDMPMPTGWLTARDLIEWRERYDIAELAHGCRASAGSIEWKRCLSSDLPRSIITAQQVFQGHIEMTPLLREPDVAEFRTGRLRLRQGAWRWILRTAWLTGHRSQRTARDEFMQRIRTIASSLIAAQDDTLVVSHAGVMVFLQKQLRDAGFTGPRFRMPEHGRLYVFDRR